MVRVLLTGAGVFSADTVLRQLVDQGVAVVALCRDDVTETAPARSWRRYRTRGPHRFRQPRCSARSRHRFHLPHGGRYVIVDIGKRRADTHQRRRHHEPRRRRARCRRAPLRAYLVGRRVRPRRALGAVRSAAAPGRRIVDQLRTHQGGRRTDRARRRSARLVRNRDPQSRAYPRPRRPAQLGLGCS